MLDRLEGWAYPLPRLFNLVVVADHAFVRAPNKGPAYFDCWGGHEDPNEYPVKYGAGNGVYDVSNSLRGPDFLGHKDTAGIFGYGIDGVCHQSANRFLLSTSPFPPGFPNAPCPAIVTDPFQGVTGGAASVLAYGTYGHSFDQFVILFKDSLLHFGPPPIQSSVKTNAESSPNSYHKELHAVHAGFADKALRGKAPNPHDHIRSEFELVIKHTLGTEFITGKTAELQGTLLKEKEAIAASNASGKDLAQRVNDAINSCLRKMATHLGADQYRKLFRLDPEVQLILVRPEIAEAAQP